VGNTNSGTSARDADIRVVIVDDDLYVRTSLARLLDRTEGIQVSATFADGLEAVASMAADPPDIALIDISMPVTDGMETTRKLRGAAPSVRILALTSVSTEQAAAGMLEAGAIGFLMKDTPVTAMVHSIRAANAGLSVLSGPATRLISTKRAEPILPDLSEVEVAILGLIAQGLTNADIAPKVFLAASTVKYHISALMMKLDASNRVALAVRATELGLR